MHVLDSVGEQSILSDNCYRDQKTRRNESIAASQCPGATRMRSRKTSWIHWSAGGYASVQVLKRSNSGLFAGGGARLSVLQLTAYHSVTQLRHRDACGPTTPIRPFAYSTTLPIASPHPLSGLLAFRDASLQRRRKTTRHIGGGTHINTTSKRPFSSLLPHITRHGTISSTLALPALQPQCCSGCGPQLYGAQ